MQLLRKHGQNSKIFLKKHGDLIAKSLCQVVLGMIGALIIIIFIAKAPTTKPKILTVNVATLTDRFIKSQAPLNLSPADSLPRLKLFSNALEQELQQLSYRHKALIMPSQAVIAGANDVTAEVAPLLDKALEHLDNVAPKPNAPEPNTSHDKNQEQRDNNAI